MWKVQLVKQYFKGFSNYKEQKVELTLSFCFSVSRLLSSSRSYRVTSTFFSQSLMRRGNSFSSFSKQGAMSEGKSKHYNYRNK